MFTVVITEKGGEQRRYDFDQAEVNIGRVQGNDIILPKGNVSKRHSRIVFKNDKFVVVDLKSTNGTYVNGRKITSPIEVKGADKIYIGDFILNVEAGAPAAAASAPDAQRAAPPPPPQRPAATPLVPPPPGPAPAPAGLAAGNPMAGNPMDSRPVASEGSVPAAGAPPVLDIPPPLSSPAPAALGADPLPGSDAVASRMPQVPAAGLSPAMPSVAAPAQIDPPAAAAAPVPMPSEPIVPPSPMAPSPAAAPAQPVPPVAAPAAPQASLSQPHVSSPVVSPQPAAAPAMQQPIAVPPPMESPAAPIASPQASADAAQTPKVRQQSPLPSDPRRQKIIELQKEIHDRLIEYLDLRRMDIDQLADEELWEKTENAISDIVQRMEGESKIPAFVQRDGLVKDVLNEALGLGALEDLLSDNSVDEIMVNHASQIYVERGGRLELSEKIFSSDKAVMGVIERIVAPLGRRIDESSPLVDARLKDGSRVNAIVPPLALKGPCITIRKFRRDMLRAEDLVSMGSMSQGMIGFLQMCVTARKNIIVAGGTGSGKTTTLNVISNFIPEQERLVTIEDAAELQLKHLHWVQLESRPANIEGKGAVPIRELVRNSLRMRPDRIIVGECRGGEALDMLQAMNTGHDGSLTTAHANTPRDTLARLETMVLMAGMDLPVRAIREQVSSALDIIVQQSRFSDGSRRVTHITEVSGMEGDVITMQDIFTFKQEGFDANGKSVGRYVPSGFVPRFYEDLQRRGIPVNMDIFRE